MTAMGAFVFQSLLAAINVTMAILSPSNATLFFAGFCVALTFTAFLDMVYER